MQNSINCFNIKNSQHIFLGISKCELHYSEKSVNYIYFISLFHTFSNKMKKTSDILFTVVAPQTFYILFTVVFFQCNNLSPRMSQHFWLFFAVVAESLLHYIKTNPLEICSIPSYYSFIILTTLSPLQQTGR